MVSDRLVAIGEIGRTYGLRGEVRVMPLTDDPSRFSRLHTCVLWDPRDGGRQPCRITGSRRQGDAVLVTVDGYDSPEAAKQLAGRLHIDEAMLDELKAIRKELMPHHVLLVVDAMTGQDAVTVAEKFNAAVLAFLRESGV